MSLPAPSPASVAAWLGHATDAAATADVLRDRCRVELRRGRPLALRLDAGSGWLLLAAVETLGDAWLQRLLQAAPGPRLLLSAERLQAIGRPTATPQAVPVPPGASLAMLRPWAALAPLPGAVPPGFSAAGPAEGEAPAWAAALALCKRARLVPALLLQRLDASAQAALAQAQVLCLAPADLGALDEALPRDAGAAPAPHAPPAGAPQPQPARLLRVSDAHVPLTAEEDCTLVLFREADGEAEHLAVIVGQPPADAPVPVRLHSACLTGDLLGSLRCDCGPQLQRAVARLAETGGVLLYLAQEGRSTGLANKLRAYRLQDEGLDTLQADRHLGFRDDERDFSVAAAMLLALGHTRIQLLTNNPQKIAALRQGGIEVVDRLPLHGQVNSHNERYLRTKQQAGHLGLDSVAASSD